MQPVKLVLIIEDEEDARLLLKRRLSANRFEVFEAKDGPTGLEQIKAERPDAIILDLMMPGQDGFQVYRVLRTDPATRKIPVLFLTAITSNEELSEEGLSLMAASKHGFKLDGHYRVMGKPYDPVVLIETIRQMLEESEEKDS